MATNASGERTMLIYQGNTLAIVKAMQREMLGTEKTMMFTLGYGHITSASFRRTRTATHLVERSAHPRSIRLESQLLNYQIPGTLIAELGRNFPGCTTIFVLRSDVRPRLEELRDAPLIPGESRPVQRGETITTHCVRIRTHLEQDLRRDIVALIHGPLQRCVMHVVPLVDGDVGLAKYIQ